MILVLSLFLLAITFIIIGYAVSHQSCSATRIEYRYVPRTRGESYVEPVPVSDIFDEMFIEPTPFVANMLPPVNKRQNINKFFISQS